jgi:hypothetical protein
MRALLDTGTTSNIVLRKFVVRAELVPTQREEQSGKHLEEHSPQIMNHFWISNFQNSVGAKW